MRPVQCMHGLLVPEIFTQCCHKKHEQEIDKEKEREREGQGLHPHKGSQCFVRTAMQEWLLQQRLRTKTFGLTLFWDVFG